ncbi:MAG TPA: hypothetical protein VIX60_08395 [Candidatus Cybelea sp.]
MLRRIELEESAATVPLQVGASRSEAVVPAVADAELGMALLPHDQPRWVKDAVAISQRAREIIAKLRPAAVRVLCFWDHRIRAIVVGDRRVVVDASGCYRADETGS